MSREKAVDYVGILKLAANEVIDELHDLRAQVEHAHAMLDHLGVVGDGFSDLPLTDRLAALGRFVVEHHGQYSRGETPPRARK